MSQTSGYSYPRVTVIRIDVHTAGETRPTRHTLPTLSPRMVQDHTYLTWFTYSNLTFYDTPTDLDRSHCSCEKGLSTQSTTHRLTDPWVHTQFLSWANQWSMGRKPSSCRWPTTRLTGPISPVCDHYIQYLLAEVNPSVLNWHRGATILEVLACHIPLPDLLNQLSPLSPKGPVRSPV
jgi:hypothetical protein